MHSLLAASYLAAAAPAGPNLANATTWLSHPLLDFLLLITALSMWAKARRGQHHEMASMGGGTFLALVVAAIAVTSGALTLGEWGAHMANL